LKIHRTRKDRLRQGLLDQEEELSPPTSQTVEKLRNDTIILLMSSGDIGMDHVRAAEDIRTIFEIVSRGMFPASSWRSETNRVPHRRRRTDFVDRMNSHEVLIWEKCYLPWSHKLSLEVVGGVPGTRWLQMVIDIVVDNFPLDDVEKKYRLGEGTALGFLVNGLDRYIALRQKYTGKVRV